MSTRKLGMLTTVAAVLLAVAVAAAINLGHRRPAVTPTGLAPTPEVMETSYHADAPEADDENDEAGPPETQEEAWAPVVDSFAENFTRTTGGKEKWRQRLIGDPKQPHVTTEVAKQLATVDIRNIPKGHYESREIVESGPFRLAVGVYYDEGWAMLLWLSTDGIRWEIDAYDEWLQ